MIPMRFPALVALFTLTGCGGGGCGGAPFVYPEPPPPAGEVQRSVFALRVEQGALDFVTTHLSDVLRATFPTREAGGIQRATVYLPEQTMDAGLFTASVRDGCIGPTDIASCPAADRTWPSRLELNLDTIDSSVRARFDEGQNGAPDSIFVSLTDFDVFTDLVVSLGVAACRISDENEVSPTLHIERLEFRISLLVDADGRLQTEITDVDFEIGAFNDASLLNIEVDSCDQGGCSDPDCGGSCGTWCSVGGFIFDSAEFLSNLLSPVINEFAPDLIEALVGGLVQQLDDQPLQSTERVAIQGSDVASILNAATAMVTHTRPAPDAFQITPSVTAPGLSLLIDGGAYGELSRCVPTVRLPDFDAGYSGPPAFNGSLRVAGRDERYHVAFTFAEGFADQLGYALYQMGGLCFSASTDDLPQLTIDTLSLIAPQLAEIGEPGAPVLFQVHPTGAPRVTFGPGSAQAGAAATFEDALVQIDFGELGVSIYTLIDQSMVRLATIASDVRVGASVVRAPDNTIELGLDGIEIENLAQVYNELAPDTDFATILDSLLSVALGQLLDGFGGFQIDPAPMVSEALGGAPIYGRINDVRRDGGTLGYLSVYFTLCDGGDLADPANTACYSPGAAQPRSLHMLQDVRLLPWPGRRFGRPTPLRLAVDDDRVYQVRVDGVSWSGMMTPANGVLEVRHPLLGLPGEHTIEVRSALAGSYVTRTATPQKLVVEVR